MNRNSPDDCVGASRVLHIGVPAPTRTSARPVAAQTAMIVEDDRAGTSSASFAELADASSRFAQLLRNLGRRTGRARC